jgi:hypothetical protein
MTLAQRKKSNIWYSRAYYTEYFIIANLFLFIVLG